MSDEKEKLKIEIHKIDEKLDDIQHKIDELENERQSLLAIRHDYQKKIKFLTPSSNGGCLNDNSSNWSKDDYSWTKNLYKHLNETFKCEKFRPLQLETINVTLSKKDCIVIMPTGRGGKSLCFQLPAIIDQGVTLVVSPLISLIEDQIWSLSKLNIHAETLNANTPKEKVAKIQDEMLNKTSNLRIVYVTPEKLAKSKRFMNKLEKMYELKLFARLVIDEIHCCSHYGHDFRPDYKFLGVMKRMFPNVPILGLTATATNNVIDDLKKILNLNNVVLFKSSFNRPNIFYEVRNKPSNHEECMNEISNLIKTQFSNQSGIVYCFSQKESEEVTKELNKRGLKTGCYHANLDSAYRSKIHENWLQNKIHVIVATIAFGMGIDKSSVRFIIHHSLSKSLENFYQESGRAGRDGEKAYSILYYRFADVFRQSSMVFTEQTGLQNLYAMVNYCIDKIQCKRNLIAQHFNESSWSIDGLCNQMCDFCMNKQYQEIKDINTIKEARIIIEILNKQPTDKRITSNKLVELAISQVNKSSKEPLSQFDLEKLVFKMILNGYLKEDFHFTPYNTICYIVKDSLADTLQKDEIFYLTVSRNLNETYVKSKKQKKNLISTDDDDEISIINDKPDFQPKKKQKS